MATGISNATTSNLEYAQNTVIASARYAQEQVPCMTKLVEKFQLKKGEKQIDVPKFGQFSAADLTDGVDMAASSQLSMSYVSLTTSEIGLKCILTDKLIRQMNEDVFKIVGRLLGDAMGRKIDQDGLAMLDGFSTSLGGAGTTLTMGYVATGVTRLEAKPAPKPYAFVHHPYAIRRIMDAVATVGTYPLPEGFSSQMLKDYWKGSLVVYGLPVFSDGNLTPDSDNDAKGAVFSKSALAYVVSQEPYTERERDASLRAWEIVHVCDMDWVELDDDYGIEMLFDATTPTS